MHRLGNAGHDARWRDAADGCCGSQETDAPTYDTAGRIHGRTISVLVLARHVGEKIDIHVADDQVITVTILEIQKSQTRLGIDAPREMLVMRREVKEREDYDGR